MPSVVIQDFKKSVMFLCTPFANRRLTYSDGLLKSPCIAYWPEGADSADLDSGFT